MSKPITQRATAANNVANSESISLLTALLRATRPRTYPLAVASIVCGTGLAFAQLGEFTAYHWSVFLLTLWVALALQILSNLANDYGDGVKGTDTHRAADSPERLTATGQINPIQFKRLIFGWAALTFASGVLLISIGFDSWRDFILFLTFGIIAIIAAMAYTMGKRPYGYRAMGEVAVLIFFGWLGVLGSVYLQTHEFSLAHLLPATGCGGLAACVLYINNMRDFDSDQQAGKITLAVLFGRRHMITAYFALLLLSLSCYLLYTIFISPSTVTWLLVLPLLIAHGKAIFDSARTSQATQQSGLIGNQLKSIVLITLFTNLLFVSSILMVNYLKPSINI
ncbi:1,4-dihydroxy-2-naphthoate octaprenyltransferase [Psychrobacter pygoscelis]|uniref:1,4-dihydroxy-2-naphthoate octaprenyltransferase n=1 Tax=Psychrobacter pygoscelis TaxID=2488563 RepID=UPI001A9561F6|nr:1,4-dihydroxy-2-naphthoate octaprenyltransferase [Psychrobacter pygoscelis]